MKKSFCKVWKEVFIVIVLVHVFLWENKIIRHDNSAQTLELLHYALSAGVILIITLDE